MRGTSGSAPVRPFLSCLLPIWPGGVAGQPVLLPAVLQVLSVFPRMVLRAERGALFPLIMSSRPASSVYLYFLDFVPQCFFSIHFLVTSLRFVFWFLLCAIDFALLVLLYS